MNIGLAQLIIWNLTDYNSRDILAAAKVVISNPYHVSQKDTKQANALLGIAA